MSREEQAVPADQPKPADDLPGHDTLSDTGAISNRDLLVKLILGPNAPPLRLSDGLAACADSIVWANRQAENYPGREVLREKLLALRRAAGHTFDELRAPDRAAMRAIEAEAGADPEGDGEVIRGLKSLITRIDKTLGAIRKGKGRGKHDPSRSPEQVCAMVIAVAWREFRGSSAPGTGQSNDACEALWSLATGKSHAIGNDNARRRWRNYIRAANCELDSGDVDQSSAGIRRLLIGQGMMGK